MPMFVLRRLDCLLEPSKDAVLEEVRFQREDAGMADLDPYGLREASGYAGDPDFKRAFDASVSRLLASGGSTALFAGA